MRSNALTPILVILVLVFIGFGDRFLPEPVGTASTQTRTSINQFIAGMFPDWRPNKLKPNERTERAIQQQEEGSQ
ncbi:MAG: hypothetical protein KME06_17895 [Kastovskya adunca ATA6-11-RM4]|jgi:hypothetical protein|nr:hypothetical protein [Kastovskya adunca ATA6-11-RM4]